MGEVDRCFKITGNPLMIGELSTAIVGKSVRPLLVRRETCYDILMDCCGGLATDSSGDGVKRLAFNQREQGSVVASAD